MLTVSLGLSSANVETRQTGAKQLSYLSNLFLISFPKRPVRTLGRKLEWSFCMNANHMLQRRCPLCDQPGRLLADITTDFSTVDYYRCDPCRHVWFHRKHDPGAPAISVTQPSTSRRERIDALVRGMRTTDSRPPEGSG